MVFSKNCEAKVNASILGVIEDTRYPGIPPRVYEFFKEIIGIQVPEVSKV